MRKTTSYFNVLVAWLLMCMVSVQMMANPITREQARKKVTTFQKMKGDSKVIKAVVNEKRLSPKRAASAAAYESRSWVIPTMATSTMSSCPRSCRTC